MRLALLIAGLLLLLGSPALPASPTEPPRIHANGEWLTGAWEGDSGNIAVFKGVPYAAPPLGDLRWRPPRPYSPPTDARSATKFAPACMQDNYLVKWYQGVATAMGHSPEVVGRPRGVSEDCLYLNIWTPDLAPARPLPVMVWVHGGSNKSGWSYEPNYIGDRLAARGVVVVSIAYRVGPFGFFSHPGLNNGDEEPIANFGLLDSVAAFRWVSEHINAFGGDPGNVTAFGESSGAGDLRDWLASELADEHLYHKMIAQSPAGALTERRTLAQEQAFGERLMNWLGHDNATLDSDKMRAIPAQDILRAGAGAEPGRYYDVVLDGLTMKSRPLETFDQEETARIRFLVGSNRDEWYMYIDPGITQADIDTWLEETAPQYAQVLRSKVAGETDLRRAFDRLTASHQMHCNVRYIAENVNAVGGHAWVYYFTRQRPGPEMKNLGAYHGTEIGYVFDQHEVWQPVDETDRELTTAVMDYWVQFARSGDPNLAGRPHWPRYTSAEPKVMELGDTIAAIPPPDADLCLWLGPRR
jgi:para-nitrobenzyl esterase